MNFFGSKIGIRLCGDGNDFDSSAGDLFDLACKSQSNTMNHDYPFGSPRSVPKHRPVIKRVTAIVIHRKRADGGHERTRRPAHNDSPYYNPSLESEMIGLMDDTCGDNQQHEISRKEVPPGKLKLRGGVTIGGAFIMNRPR